MTLYKWILWLFLCGIIYALEDDLFLEIPKIIAEDDEVILNPGENFSIDCASAYPITWKAFKEFNGKYRVTHTEKGGTELPYESTMHLIDVTYHYVGHFFCVTNRTQSDYDYSVGFIYDKVYRDFSGVNSVYVYVKDTHNLLVHRDVPEMTVVNDKFLILTCKPTMYDTELALYEGTFEEEKARYHDEIGFLLPLSSVTDIYGKSYTCRINEGEDQDQDEHKTILSSLNSINFTVTYHVAKVRSLTGLYGSKGGQLTLDCSIDILMNETFDVTWKFNKNSISAMGKRFNESTQTINNPTKSSLWIGVGALTIFDVDIEDSGYYECEIVDHFKNRLTDQILIEILERDDDSIEVYTANRTTEMEVSSWRSEAVWHVRYKGHPRPILVWSDNTNKVIETSDKYEVLINSDSTILKIKKLSLNDSGNYTLSAGNSLSSVNKQFELRVKASPEVTVKLLHVNSVQEGNMANFRCTSYGYPLPKIKWMFITCKSSRNWPDCVEQRRTEIEAKYFNTLQDSDFSQTSVLSLNTTKFGKVECSGVNTEGMSKFKEYTYGRIDLQIRRLPEDPVIVVGDNVTLICEAPVDRYQNLKWLLNDSYIFSNDTDDYRNTELYDTNGLYRLKLTLTDIKTENSGKYTCHARDILLNKYEKNELVVKVHELMQPTINGETNVEEEVERLLGTSVRLYCNILGLLDPNIKWYKDNVLIRNDARFSLDEHGRILNIKNSKMEDDGNYTCVGINGEGKTTKLFTLKITNTNQIRWIIGVVVLLMLVVCCTIYLYARFRQLRVRLHEAGLLDFEKGNPDRINPDLAFHEQANLLPYNKKYEFSKKKLQLGKQLGAGAFGVVVQALATGIIPNEENTKVAVKMLKETAGNEEIRALVTELKMMANLGQHLNIVNLLGAVTKNITKYELMVIVEYCRFGNLQNFLVKHRNRFIDQINIVNDSIDTTVFHDSECESSVRGDSGGFTDSICQNPSRELISGNTETSFTTATSNPSSTNLTTGDDDTIHPMRSITTSDLVCWLFQVARGMNYLSSRKVLHGDLAARNVLLSDGNVVKICDFGLARSLYENCSYKKEGDAPLPIKWLAIESFFDRVFSTFTDVWSFGILMWELFSLGATPYPDLSTNQDLFIKLKDGYRMDKPKNATRKIYDIMLHCWNLNPESRPLFNALEDRLRKLLENGVAKHYVDLNEQYVEMNAKNFGEGQTDYLSLLGLPEQPPPPPSIPSLVQSIAVPGYLPMRSISPDCGDHVNAVSNVGYAKCTEIDEVRTHN